MQQQKFIFKTELAQTTPSLLTFNIPDINGLFPGFRTGEFAVVYGPQFVTSLVSQLCVRAQMPKRTGGLESKVVFIDAASSSSLSNILETAELQNFNPKTALEKLVNIRVYTAYRLTSLIMEQLEETVKVSGAKLVVISDIAFPFLNGNVDDQEAKAVYNQIMSYLASFARKHRIIIIATYLSHESNRRNSILQEISTTKANTVLRFTKTPYTSDVELEKHSSYMLGVSEFAPDKKTLTDPATTNSELTLSYRIL